MSGARGTVIRRGKGYSVILDLGRDAEGKRVRKWHSGYKDKTEAEEARTDLLSKLDKGEYTPPNRLTVKQFAEGQWLPSIEALVAGERMKPSTAASYRVQINAHVIPGIGSVVMKDLNGPMLNKLYTKLLTSGRRKVSEGQAAGLSPTSVHLVHVTIHRMLKDAVRWNVVPRNWADLADPPRARKSGEETMETWTPEQLRTFVEAVSMDRLQALWLTLITTGLRRGEIAGLRWQDVKLDTRRLRISRNRVVVDHKVIEGTPKTPKSRRDIGIDPATVAALKAHKARQAEERLAWGPTYQATDLIFTWEDGRPLHPDLISRTFVRLASKCDLPRITIHGLRHSYATAALEAGVALKVISDRLGHSSISITADIYSHVRPEIDQAAANQVAGLILGGAS